MNLCGNQEKIMNALKRIGVRGMSLHKINFGSFKPEKIAKKTVVLFIATMFFAFLATSIYVQAEEQSSTAVAVLKFTAGVATSMLIHEGAHALVAGVTDVPMSWKAGTYNQPIGFTENAGSDAKGVALYSAGLLSQAITSEAILQIKKVDKNDAYVRGLMAWNILNPILYSLDYWILHNSNKQNGKSYQGDMVGIEHYSNKATADGYAIGMTAIAVFQGYRFLKTQSWAPDWLKTEKNKFLMAPLPSGGFMAGYHFSF
jgi:hypothetical protein